MESVFEISKAANCSALDLFNEDVDTFFVMVSYYFEKISLKETEEKPKEKAKVKDNFWDF